MKNTGRFFFAVLAAGALLIAGSLYAQPARGASRTVQPDLTPGELSLRRISLFSSGVGYFEHSGTVSGPAELSLLFDLEAVNDALKSLIINDNSAASPSVNYPSEETLEKTLQSLGIDLSNSPGTAEIFAAQRGAEIEVYAPNPIRGRIVGVEYRNIGFPENRNQGIEALLSLYTGGAFRVIALKDIASFTFTDPELNAGLIRALDLIALNRTSSTRSLQVRLPGSGSRPVSLSYVIPVPVWKVSYRLDLDRPKPLLQGWAIIDNNSDTDWNDVELSLVSGRPVSFIQNLYPPYYLQRPTLPLSIAGTAQARSHASGSGRAESNDAYMLYDEEMEAAPQMESAFEMSAAKAVARSQPAPRPAAPNMGSVAAAASGAQAADQFAYTVKDPVTLSRRQSAMIPLVEGTVAAEKSIILSGSRASGGGIHPELSAELTNTTKMKLPAGPITVFDGGTYAGDALIEFFSENEKRFISYGEDLSVTGSASYTSSRLFSSVTISKGVMTINRRQSHERTYTVKNTSGEAKRLIIEHSITAGASLVEPKTYLEKTDSLYRFVQNLPARGEITFTVKEETPVSERVVLASSRIDTIVSYSTSQEFPANVRAALARAVELQQKVNAARAALTEKETRRQRLIAEQDRIRNNLAAVGNSTDLGREYLKRMTALDSDIDGINGEIDAAAREAQSAQQAFENYIAALSL
jgi:hypothetical protein